MKKLPTRQQCFGIDAVGRKVAEDHNKSIDHLAQAMSIYSRYQQACRDRDPVAKQQILKERNALL